MENIQALCLLGGGVILWARARASGDVAAKYGLELASLGFITMFLLEYDVRPFGIAPLTWLLNGAIRNIWLAAIWVYCIARAARNWPQVFEQRKIWFRSLAAPLLGLSALFWLGGAVVDRLKPYSGSENMFAEEFLETQAALLMLWGAAELILDSRPTTIARWFLGPISRRPRAG